MSTAHSGRRRLRSAALIAIAAAALGVAAYFAVGLVGGHHSTIATIKATSRAGEMTVTGAGKENNEISARDRWFFHQRAYPNKLTPSGALQRAMRQTLALRRSSTDRETVTSWSPIGPNPINAIGPDASLNSGQYGGAMPVAGRVSAIAPAPNNASIVYVGGANGGVWKSVNGGASWAPVWPQSMASFSIGSIAVNPNNYNDVWVGTGEANGAGDTYYGNGLYHSTTGGTSWVRVDAAAKQFQGCFISSLALVPVGTATPTVNAAVLEFPGVQNPACTSAKRGIWHITNANTATPTLTRETMTGSTYQAPNNFASVASAPNTIYASAYLEGIWRSTNGGATWTKVNVTATGLYRLAVSAYSVSTIYVDASDSAGQGWGGLYKITGANTSSPVVTTLNAASSSNSPCTYPAQGGGQCGYDLTVAADPKSASYVFAGGIRVYRFTTAGLNAGTNIGYGGGTGNIHVDQHATVFDATGNMWEGSDGGVYDLPLAYVPGGNHNFVDRNGAGTTALGITEFNGWLSGAYTGTLSTDTLIGGTQDNGTAKYTHATGLNWRMDHGGDGGASAYINTLTYFASYYGTAVFRTITGGNCSPTPCSSYKQIFSSPDPAEFYAPMEQDPANLTTLYRGTDAVYRTINATATTPAWVRISPHWSISTYHAPVSAIGMNKATAPTYVYAGVDAGCNSGGSCPYPPKLEYTHTATATTPIWYVGAGLPARYITDIWVNPSNASNAILTVSGFGTGHVWKTVNGGANWTNISGSTLPNVPVNAVAVDPANAAKVFLGTDTGVFYTTTGTSATPVWTNLNGTTLPNTVVMDLVLQNGKLIAATHGRSAWVATEP